MSKSLLTIKDGLAATKTLSVDDTSGTLTPYHLEDTDQRAALLTALTATTTAVGTLNTNNGTALGTLNTSNTAIANAVAGTLKTREFDGAGNALRTQIAAVTGTLTATGASSVATIRGDFNVSFWGTFSATLVIERSFDSGTTWLPLTALGTPVSFTTPATEIFSEPENAVRYRINCTAFTSGTINYRISQ